MNPLQTQAIRFSAGQGQRGKPIQRLALAAQIEFRTVTCRGCGGSFISPAIGGVTAVFCSDTCRNAKHPELNVAKSTNAPKPAIDHKATEWAKICPKRYLRYDHTQLPPKAQAMAVSVLAWRPGVGGRGLALCGHSEAGKSFLAHELAKRLFFEGCDVALCYLPSLVIALKGGYEMSIAERSALISRCRSAEILLIDDLGMECDTLSTIASLYELLDCREREERPNIITTNKDDVEMRAQFPAPLYNRLARTVEWIGI